jgi:hypothetical protein
MSLAHFDTMIGFTMIVMLFSLLITVLVQMASSALNLRGKNLFWGVKRLLIQIDPNIGSNADKIAKAILSHPSLAPDSVINLPRTQYASAIRPHELLRAIQDLSINGPAETKTAIANLLKVGLPGVNREMSTEAQALADELAKLTPDQAYRVRVAVERLTAEVGGLEAQVNKWFKSVMDRTTERFVYHARVWTAVCAGVFAFALHVDSMRILRRLSEDPDLRSRLVGMADTTIRQGQTVLTTVNEKMPTATEVLNSLRPALDSAGFPPVPPGLITANQGRDWIHKNSPDSARGGRVDSLFADHFVDADTLWNGRLRWAASGLDSTLEAMTFSPILSPVPGYCTYFRNDRCSLLIFGIPNSHFLGTLISVLLLSLGAPFWFNALQTIVNLRPIVAGKIEKESAEG